MTAAGLIFSNIHDQSVPQMTATRTMASLPFGGRYRLVDFALSNMVNSGITKVGIVTHNNYRSLMDHIGTGKDWDLARRGGGVIILPPFVTAYENSRAGKLYTTRLEALIGVMEFIKHCSEDAIVLSDCDAICNINLSKILEEHEQDGADLTIVTKQINLGSMEPSPGNSIIYADEDGNVTDFVEHTKLLRGEHDVSTNIMVFSKSFLLTLLLDALAHGYTSFYRQALSSSMGSANIRIYRHDGYFGKIDSLSSYYHANIDLLRTHTRDALFNVKDRPVYTKVRNSPPTQYGDGAVIANALIADGCRIDGTVVNSILFRGVQVRRGTVVKNSVLLQDSITGENVTLNCVIADKNVIIRDARTLAGHESLPFYISKGKMI
ncbi:glycogen biosynthesis protein GlgD [Clostridiales bacterium]|nr:glucose-1-phosphate adenylyltransferase subunit GlgD [Clostridiales bacterium]GFI56392.1 glycogen biosynthesis protein GlgD [Clostridiales bacterium]